MKKIVLYIFIAISLVFVSKIQIKDPLQPEIAEKILRFHVLANSDSTEDQEVKLKVRDGVGSYVETLLADVDSRQETEQVIDDNMENIIEVANEILDANGMDYEATGQITQAEFPVKTYGDYTFPEGEYRALQIKLGDAKGHNWWCVLYPNLCFRGTMYEEVDDEADQKLREVLSVEEYKDVINSGNFVIQFKILEYLPFTR